MNIFFQQPHEKEEEQQASSREVSLDQSSSSSRLKDLVGNNPQMYFALQNFLLQSPETQVPRLGEVNLLVAMGDSARASGNTISAGVDYETAAKIEIYRQNKDSARNCLLLAEEVSEKGQPHYEFQKTMLANMDEVLRISKAYHEFEPTV
ncbi:MAG: hypothetical protein ACREBS_03270 [Nitrososphaerales archaeon]